MCSLRHLGRNGMSSEQDPQVLILDDGELTDVRSIFDDLRVPFSENPNDAHAAGDVHVDVARGQVDAAAAVEHGEEPREAAVVYPDAGAAGGRVSRGGDQGLHLDQHRPRPLQDGSDARARSSAAALGEEELARVLDALEPLPSHTEDAHLLGGAEAVLGGAQQPERMPAVAFEREHDVDQVLQQPGDAGVRQDVQEKARALCQRFPLFYEYGAGSN